MDSSLKIKMGKFSSGSIVFGFLVMVLIRLVVNDSIVLIVIISR